MKAPRAYKVMKAPKALRGELKQQKSKGDKPLMDLLLTQLPLTETLSVSGMTWSCPSTMKPGSPHCPPTPVSRRRCPYSQLAWAQALKSQPPNLKERGKLRRSLRPPDKG